MLLEGTGELAGFLLTTQDCEQKSAVCDRKWPSQMPCHQAPGSGTGRHKCLFFELLSLQSLVPQLKRTHTVSREQGDGGVTNTSVRILAGVGSLISGIRGHLCGSGQPPACPPWGRCLHFH